MSTGFSLVVLLLVSVLGLVLGSYKRVLLWRSGKGVSDSPGPGSLLTIPKRYFVDLHNIVQRDNRSAYMHMSLAGAVVLIVLLSFISIFWPADMILVLKSLFSAALALLAVGTILVVLRRGGNPDYLSYGAYQYTSLATIALLMGLFLVLWSDYIMVGTILATLGLLIIFWSGLFDMPLKHMIAGAAHLAFHPRQERFTGKIASGLKLADTSTEKIGVQSASDFTWQQILSFDACIECGRCQKVCPAFESGQPLNPKKLIQDLHLLSKHSNDIAYTGAHHPHKVSRDIGIDGEIDKLIDKDTLYSCTSCRACVYECPMMIEHVDAIVDMRRHYATNRGDLPEKAAEALVNLRQTDTVGGYDNSLRHQWMADLDLPWAQPEKSYDLLLLCGESVFELRAQKSVRQLIDLVTKAGKTIALLQGESDIGDLARRLGDELLFQKLAQEMIQRLDAVSFDQIITLDPHIYHCIKNEYPPLGGNYQITHASSYLYKLIVEDKQLQVGKLNESLTYHDPCYLGRYNGVIDAPRALMAHIGVKVEEMERSKMSSRCCGWGGGSAFSDIAGDRRIPDMRMDDIRQTGSDRVAVSCPNCMTMLEGVVEPRADVVDLVSLVAQAADTFTDDKEAR